MDNLPEKERAEIREIYEAKGFEGELLEQVVEVICADRDRWVDVMMKEELEMQEETKSPFAMGAVTFVSFILVGLIPLLVYVYDYAADGLKLDLFACPRRCASCLGPLTPRHKSSTTVSIAMVVW